eukprot:Hpha_TRINITY_DN16822_c0_g4::TRINITY_DN16822_c0_g4_i1::g.149744::m.149744
MRARAASAATDAQLAVVQAEVIDTLRVPVTSPAETLGALQRVRVFLRDVQDAADKCGVEPAAITQALRNSSASGAAEAPQQKPKVVDRSSRPVQMDADRKKDSKWLLKQLSENLPTLLESFRTAEELLPGRVEGPDEIASAASFCERAEWLHKTLRRSTGGVQGGWSRLLDSKAKNAQTAPPELQRHTPALNEPTAVLSPCSPSARAPFTSDDLAALANCKAPFAERRLALLRLRVAAEEGENSVLQTEAATLGDALCAQLSDRRSQISLAACSCVRGLATALPHSDWYQVVPRIISALVSRAQSGGHSAGVLESAKAAVLWLARKGSLQQSGASKLRQVCGEAGRPPLQRAIAGEALALWVASKHCRDAAVLAELRSAALVCAGGRTGDARRSGRLLWWAVETSLPPEQQGKSDASIPGLEQGREEFGRWFQEGLSPTVQRAVDPPTSAGPVPAVRPWCGGSGAVVATVGAALTVLTVWCSRRRRRTAPVRRAHPRAPAETRVAACGLLQQQQCEVLATLRKPVNSPGVLDEVSRTLRRCHKLLTDCTATAHALDQTQGRIVQALLQDLAACTGDFSQMGGADGVPMHQAKVLDRGARLEGSGVSSAAVGAELGALGWGLGEPASCLQQLRTLVKIKVEDEADVRMAHAFLEQSVGLLQRLEAAPSGLWAAWCAVEQGSDLQEPGPDRPSEPLGQGCTAREQPQPPPPHQHRSQHHQPPSPPVALPAVLQPKQTSPPKEPSPPPRPTAPVAEALPPAVQPPQPQPRSQPQCPPDVESQWAAQLDKLRLLKQRAGGYGRRRPSVQRADGAPMAAEDRGLLANTAPPAVAPAAAAAAPAAPARSGSAPTSRRASAPPAAANREIKPVPSRRPQAQAKRSSLPPRSAPVRRPPSPPIEILVPRRREAVAVP